MGDSTAGCFLTMLGHLTIGLSYVVNLTKTTEGCLKGKAIMTIGRINGYFTDRVNGE